MVSRLDFDVLKSSGWHGRIDRVVLGLSNYFFFQ